MSNRFFAVFALLALGPSPASAQAQQSDPTTWQLTYLVTVEPQNARVVVTGTVENLGRTRLQWVVDRNREGAPDSIKRDGGTARFERTIPLVMGDTANSIDAFLDVRRFRAWGKDIFPHPKMAKEHPPIEVTLRTPATWSVMTAAGASVPAQDASANAMRDTTVRVETIPQLKSLPIFAGEIEVAASRIGNTIAYGAIQADMPVDIDTLQDGYVRLLAAFERYLEDTLHPRIALGVDHRGARRTPIPGNNRTVPGQASVLLVFGDEHTTANPQFFGTISHELAHNWMVRVFGGQRTTYSELGTFFAEGFTDYLAYHVAHEAGVVDREGLERVFSKFYLQYRFIKTSGGEQNARALPYKEGFVVAWILDLELHRRSGGRYDFRDLMVALIDRHGGTDGLTVDEMKAELDRLGGEGLGALLDRLRRGSEVVDMAEWVSGTGIDVAPAPQPRRQQLALEASLGKSSDGLGPEDGFVVRFSPDTAEEEAFLQRFLDPVP